MLAEHYVQLCKEILPHWKREQVVEVTLAQVADVLCCTTRNANLLLKRMAEYGWLEWTPGRGRGNVSRLRLVESPEALVLSYCEELAQAGRVQDALERLQHEAVSSGGQEKFWAYLYQKFGYQQERGSERMLDVLRFPFYRALETVHPFYVSRRSENQIVRHAMDGLVSWNKERRAYEGQIAHDWEVDARGVEWTFYLRKGVRFHNGRELVADDVAATFTALLDPLVDSPAREMFSCMREVIAEGTYTVRFSLHVPHPLFLNLLGQTCASIRPRDVLTKETRHERLPIGAGPFRLVRNDAEQIVLEAFAGYHRGRPWLDRMEMWVVPDAADRERFQEKGGGNFYYLGGLNGKSPDHWQRKVQVEPGARFIVWNFNKRGIHHDLRFRQAMHLILDRTTMIRELGGARAFPAYGLLSQMERYRVEISAEVSQAQAFVDEQAVCTEVRKLLDEAGYQGEPMRVLIYESPENVEDLQWICQRAAAFGVQLIPDIRDRDEFQEQKRMAEVELVFVGLVAEEDEELSLYDMYMTAGNQFRNPLGPVWQERIAERLKKLLRLPDSEARFRAFAELEAWLVAEGVVHFLYHIYSVNHYHPNLLGASIGAQGYVDFRKLWWKSRKES